MSRRAGPLVGLAACALVLAPAAAASAADAASITAVGWWTQRPGASELPEGSFEVALVPNEPVSLAALRIDVRFAQLTSATLTLTESEQVLADVAGVQACPTDDAWSPANPGPWSEAPTPDCEGAAVSLARNDNGTWTGDVRPLLRPGTVSIVLVPVSEVSDQQQSFAFRLVFESATISAEAPAPAPAGPTQPGPAFPPAVPAPVAPASLPPAPPPAPPAAAPGAARPTTPPSTPASEGFGLAAGENDGEPKPWWRLAFGVPLSIVAGVVGVGLRRLLQQRQLIES